MFHQSEAMFTSHPPTAQGSSVFITYNIIVMFPKVLVCFSHTLCNRFTIFVVWNDCKVYMSSGQMSCVLDLIFRCSGQS